MEKQLDDKGSESSAVNDMHQDGHSGAHKEDKHNNKGPKEEDIEGGSTPSGTHDEGKSGAGHLSAELCFMHEKHASHNKDTGLIHESNGELDSHAKHTRHNDSTGMVHEPQDVPPTHGKHSHDGDHADIAHESPKSPSIEGKHTSHEINAGVTHESSKISDTHGKNTHIHEDGGVTHEPRERLATHGTHTHNEEHVSVAHEAGERYKTHWEHTDDIESLHETGERPTTREKLVHGSGDVDSASQFKENPALQGKRIHGDEAAHTTHASREQSTVDEKHSSDVEDANMSHTPREMSPQHEKHVHDGADANVIHEHGHRHEKHRSDVVHAGRSQDHEEKCRSADDECESKKAFSDENSSRDRVHFSRGSTPDVDTPTQHARSPFNSTKPLKAGLKGMGNTERGPGSADGNMETPSTSWAFSARASIAPSKFDHMATLRMTYSAYKESKQGKEGVPLSLLPEILESARFMVPPPRDLVPLLQRIDFEYKSGELVRWSLLQNLALQIERKEARYPSVFIPRCSVVRPNSNSPNSWKALQRSPSRRTHPEDDCPELEPQVYEMMKEIDNHRRKSAKEGNYLAADAAAQRLLELKLFEDNKRRATMLERHAQEREQAEKAYKEELQERNQLWDERLKNFQKEVVDHAQRLKQQHIAAQQHYKEKMASKTPVKAQWSRELLKQRRIQIYLGKQGKYLEAQEVKQSADRMEQAELQAAIAAFQAEVIGKEQTIRVKQQTEMDILLQRAARTREEIRKSRTLDLQRCHQRHKNVMRELAAIQKQEVFRFDQLMQKKVQNPYTGVAFGGQRIQSPSSRSHINAPDYSTDDALYSGGEDSSMKD